MNSLFSDFIRRTAGCFSAVLLCAFLVFGAVAMSEEGAYPDRIVADRLLAELVDITDVESVRLNFLYQRYLYEKFPHSEEADEVLFKIAILGERFVELPEVDSPCYDNCTWGGADGNCSDEKERAKCLDYKSEGIIKVELCCLDAITIYDDSAWKELAEKFPDSPLAAIAMRESTYIIDALAHAYCSPNAGIFEHMGTGFGPEYQYEDQIVCLHDSGENRWKRIEDVISRLEKIVRKYPGTETAVKAARTIDGIRNYYAFRLDSDVFVGENATPVFVKRPDFARYDDMFFDSFSGLLEKLGFTEQGGNEYVNAEGKRISFRGGKDKLTYYFDGIEMTADSSGYIEGCKGISGKVYTGSCGELALVSELLRVAGCEVTDTELLKKGKAFSGDQGMSKVILDCR